MKFRQIGALALLLISSLVVANDAEPTAWINANGYTIGTDGKLMQFSQMLVEADEIVAIAHAISMPDDAKVIDAQGQPTGLLIDNAMYLVEKHIPPVDDRLLAKYLDKASEHLLKLAITSAHDAGISAQVVDFFTRSAPNLNVRIYAMIAATDPQLSQLLQSGHIEDDAGMLSIRSVKVYGDGALGS